MPFFCVLKGLSNKQKLFFLSYTLKGGLLQFLGDSTTRATPNCLPNVSVNRAFKNNASNPKKKQNHFST